MGPMRFHIARCVGLLLTLAVSTSAYAQSWDSFPTLNGSQRAGIIKRYDSPRYDDLRRCLRRFDSKVDATYYGAMVDITDESGSRSRKSDDATPYAEALSQHWSSEPGLDLTKHVVIVLGIQNRSLGIDVGTEWEKIGFEGDVVTDTVQASEYGRFMRRRDYGGAICALATAIDFRLAGLRQSMERRIEEVGAIFPDVEAELGELNKRLKKTFPEPKTYTATVEGDLSQAKKFLDEAKKTLEDDPASSVQKVDKARAAMKRAEEALDQYDTEVGKLKEIEAELEELGASIAARPDSDWDGPTEAAKLLETCSAKVTGIRDNLDGDPAEIRVCIAEARGILAAADVRYEYRAGTIPTIFFIFFAFVIVSIVIMLFLRRRRRTRLIDQDLTEWERRLAAADSQTRSLTERFPAYFAMGDVAWQGESAELDAKTADAVNRAFFLLGHGNDVLKAARADRSSGHPLSVLPLERAARKLREAPADLPAGTQVTASPLSVPTTQNYQGTSVQLLGDLSEAIRTAEQHLSASAEVLQRLSKQTQAGNEAERDAVAAVEGRKGLGLDPSHLVAPLEEARQVWKSAREFTASDPLRSDREGVLEKAREQIVTVRDRAVRGNEVVETIRNSLAADLQGLKRTLSEMEASGFQLKEPNFDAKAELSDALNEAKDLVARVGAGDERRAIAGFEELEADAAELKQRVNVIAEAKTLVPQMATALDDLREAARGDILKLRIGIGKLPEGKIPQADVDELNAFQTTLGRVNGEITRLRKAHTEQAYLAATAQVHRLVSLMERGVALVNRLATASGIELQNTPKQVAFGEAWLNSASASWKSDDFGAGATTSRKLF